MEKMWLPGSEDGCVGTDQGFLSSGSSRMITDEDQRRQERANNVPLIKSQNYISGADDSGFCDSYPQAEVDDNDVYCMRKMYGANSGTDSVCSTPNKDNGMRELPPPLDVPGSSPIPMTFPNTPSQACPFPFANHTTKWPGSRRNATSLAVPEKPVSPLIKICGLFGKYINQQTTGDVKEVKETQCVEKLNAYLQPKSVAYSQTPVDTNPNRTGAIVSILNSAPLNADFKKTLRDNPWWTSKTLQSSNTYQPKKVLAKDLRTLYSPVKPVYVSKPSLNITKRRENKTDNLMLTCFSDVSDVEMTPSKVTWNARLKKPTYRDASDTECPANVDMNHNICPKSKQVRSNVSDVLTKGGDVSTTSDVSSDESSRYNSGLVSETLSQRGGNVETTPSKVTWNARLKKPTYRDVSDIECPTNVDLNHNICPKSKQVRSDVSDALTKGGDASTMSDATLSQRGGISRKRKGRKLYTPRRGASRVDPRFKGATVWIQTIFKKGVSQLQISGYYSNVHTRSPRSHSSCCPPPLSETDDNTTTKDFHVTAKTCASCKTRRTPLWRDSEDGTPLCNACGIRYKKYRLRCSRCWHIPKKDVKTYPHCPVCAALLRYSFHKKNGSW